MIERRATANKSSTFSFRHVQRCGTDATCPTLLGAALSLREVINRFYRLILVKRLRQRFLPNSRAIAVSATRLERVSEYLQSEFRGDTYLMFL